MKRYTDRLVLSVVCLVIGVFAGWLLSYNLGSDRLVTQRAARPTLTSAQPVASDLTPDDLARLVSLITALPGWTDRGPDTTDEWQSILHAAAILQLLDPRDVGQVMQRYAAQLPSLPPPHISGSPDPRTKPLLLLRVMFDIPTKAAPSNLGSKAWGPAGWFMYQSVPGAPRGSEVALPVAWTAAGPELVATRMFRGFGASGWSEYNAAEEFRLFRSHFKYRQDIESFLSSPITGWHDVAVRSRSTPE